MQLLNDGARRYSRRDTFSDITLNGVSVAHLKPSEACVWPDGWGYVLLGVDPDTGQEKIWLDGQRKTHIRRGRIVITP